ncbi:MAG: UDP-N-acetylglucosamine 2-epimerase (hydrolyzing) [Synergistaceae bacterium]|nr:UDP-N-acetylglucosamine 2-epimerase (hydrolyzing) [Synergistaceae bacterium]
MTKKRIVFITGTRADYGKIKSLMRVLNDDPDFEIFVFVCGMHLSKIFGATYQEVQKDNYKNIYIAYGLLATQDVSINMGNMMMCFSGYIDSIKPDMIIIHGDRMEALSGAIVGAMHNIPVGHIEGGELSGTIDESIRHAISKFAHVHFVCTEEARTRLLQIGEEPERIYVIGSPDIDIMMSNSLPSLQEVKERYEINFSDYGILMYHPVTTEYNIIGEHVKIIVDAVIESMKNFVVIFPNNDLGSEVILNEYERLSNNERFRVIPSMRFEYFLTLLKNSGFIAGNSSAGIRESGVYGIPAIDIGTRQSGRYSLIASTNIQHVNEDKQEILNAITKSKNYRKPSLLFGDGRSVDKFMSAIKSPDFWDIKIQKHFIDYDIQA